MARNTSETQFCGASLAASLYDLPVTIALTGDLGTGKTTFLQGFASALGISKSTLSDWLARIPYSPNAETIERIGKARAVAGEVKSRIKQKSIEEAGYLAHIELGQLSKRDLFLIGLGLYVGEGTKSTAETRVVNSNHQVAAFFVRWFEKSLGIPTRNIRVRLHLYPDSNGPDCVQFWSKQLSIPEDQFYKSIIDRRTNKKVSNAGKVPYGTAHLMIRSLGEKRFGVFLARKIMAWSDIVLNTP